MARTRSTRIRKPDAPAIPTPISDELLNLWLLRILLPLEGHKTLVKQYYFDDDNVARLVGLAKYIDDPAAKYDRKLIVASLRRQWLAAERRDLPAEDTLVARNIRLLGEAVGLSELEMRIAQFVNLGKAIRPLETALDMLGSMQLHHIEHVLSVCLGVDLSLIRKALDHDGTLFKAGILWVDTDGFSLFSGKVEVLGGLDDEMQRHHDQPLSLFRNNLVESQPAKLSPGSYPHLARDIDALRKYFTDAYQSSKRGVNVLLYGMPGSGKTEFVRMLAADLGHEVYEVATQNRRGTPLKPRARFRSYRLAQAVLPRHKAIVLFDEVEDVFHDAGEAPGSKGNKSGIKAWINQMLENNAVPTFWLANSIESVDPAFIRRFDYVIELNAPPRSVRLQVLDNYLSGLPVSDTWKQQVAEHDEMVPGVVERAAKVIRVVSSGLSPAETEQALNRVLDNTLDALGLKSLPTLSQENSVGYRLDMLNSDCDMQQVRDGLALHRQGRVCLYGPPGTGKTAFGRHIATSLDLPLMVKRASDILSPYVGMTERNMAHVFRQAKEEGSVILLDEADTFLRNRSSAQHSWEVSEVNEILTQMEAFDGIFIASTNLMDSLDSAALRRFDLKIRFGYLAPDQAWAMFQDLSRKLGLEPQDSLRNAVNKLSILTPGDCTNVLRQSRLRKITRCEDIYERLAAECAAKPDGRRQSIGFFE
jgi:SpoVK/Ycf46/Vps4 family AAA+-type ATPase